MITSQSWKAWVKKQAELDKLIVEKSPTDLKWISQFNAERLKLALLVEVGEFANEIKSFKAWRKKPEVDWTKAKEELIDCLGYFLGLINIYQIGFPPIFKTEYEPMNSPFNELLLTFFAHTNDLFIVKDEHWYKLETNKLTEKKGLDTYHKWFGTFENLCWKLQMDEKELLAVYLSKNKINQQRAKA